MQINTSTGTVDVADAVFDCPYNQALIHQTLNFFVRNAHTGSKAQKTRAMVSGGGRKPWKQKGTGNARVGSSRNPIWRGGGRAFAATPDKRKTKLNKKMYRQAMKSLISELYRQNRLNVVDEFSIDEPKTRLVIEKIKSLSLMTGTTLIVLETDDIKVELATRNIPTVGAITASLLNPFIMLRFDNILFTKSAIIGFQERFV